MTTRFLLLAVAFGLLQAPWVDGPVRFFLWAAVTLAGLETVVDLVDRLADHFEREISLDQEPRRHADREDT